MLVKRLPLSFDWDIVPIEAHQDGDELFENIGSLVSEDQIFELMGLRAEENIQPDANVETDGGRSDFHESVNVENADVNENDNESDDDLDDDLDDALPGEDAARYDLENPPMEVGTLYPSMEEFRVALKHHAIMGQFEWATEKSCTTRHRAYCVAPGCPWAIVARLTRDEKSVRVCALLFLFSYHSIASPMY